MYIYYIRFNCDIFMMMFGYDEIKNYIFKKKKICICFYILILS